MEKLKAKGKIRLQSPLSQSSFLPLPKKKVGQIINLEKQSKSINMSISQN